MTKENNAQITIKNNSKAFADDSMELVTEGGYYEKDGVFYIMYKETEQMEMANCSVIIKISPDEVVVTRKGDYNSKMHYIEGQSTEFVYHIPYGDIPIILNTAKIKADFDENGGSLGLFYSLMMQGEKIEHKMTVIVKKKG